MIYYVVSSLLIAIGLYALVIKKNLIKKLVALGIIETGINLLIISIGFVNNGTAPIFSREWLVPLVPTDPVPQALTLTSIVIGASQLALAAAFVIVLYKHHGTLDVRKIRSLKW